MAWAADADAPRLAAISAFGFSGTNAHLIVAEAPSPRILPTSPLPCVLPLSADSPAALDELIARYKNHLAGEPRQPLVDVAATAALGRKHFAYRLAVASADSEEMLHLLGNYLQQPATAAIAPGCRNVFLFTGQGSQYPAMGHELYKTQACFRQVVDECASLFAPYLGLSLSDVLFAGQYSEQELAQTGLAQPALFTLEYALARQWQAFGVNPEVLIGHSIGEYAAACLAGIFDLEQAVKLVAMRGLLMQELKADGKMAAVSCSRRQLDAVLQDNKNAVIACFNGPQRFVISGLATAVDMAMERFVDEGVNAIPLNVSHAFHAPLMAAMLPEFRETLQQTDFKKPALRIISTLSGTWVDEQMSRVDYWLEQIVKPVDFYGAINTLSAMPAAGRTVMLEIGPRTVLNPLARLAIDEGNISWLSALDRGIDDNRRIADNLAQLYNVGLPINWREVYGQRPFNKVVLPTYPFQRQRYWLDEIYTGKPRTAGGGHPLLGQRLPSPLALQYQQQVSKDEPAWLAGHAINGEVLFPLAGYLEMAMAAAEPDSELADIVIGKACRVDDSTMLLHTVLQNGTVGIHSLRDETWRQHFGCVVKPLIKQAGRLDPEQLKPANIDDFYRQNTGRGYQFKSDFLSLKTLHHQHDEAIGFAAHNGLDPRYRAHPVLLDGALQTALTLIPGSSDDCYAPFTVERFALWGNVEGGIWSHAKLRERHRDTFIADLNLYDADLQAIGLISGVLFKRLPKKAQGIDELLYQVDWQAQDLPRRGPELPASLRASLDETTAFQSIQGSAGRLDRLAVAYICEGLRELGCREQQAFASVQDFMQQLGVAQRFERLFRRIVTLLSESGLAEQNSGVQIGEITRACEAVSLLKQLQVDFPALHSETELLQRCGANLAEIWRGNINALSLIFPADKPEATTYFYRHAVSFAALNNALGDALALLRDDYPAQRPCRILEIGAGTGSASSFVLARLKDRPCRYTFTDVSAYFLGQAKTAFSDYDFIDYRCLNIELDPLTQGYDAQGYDLIIASNVLHATCDLVTALQHCRLLLAPGGKLVLMEGVQATPWIDAIFGLTDGWWAYRDALRQDYPLLNEDQWRQALAALDMDLQCLTLEHRDAPFKQALMITGERLPQALKTWLVMDDGRGVGDTIIDALTADGARCIRGIAGAEFLQRDERCFQLNPDCPEDYRRLLNAVEADTKIEAVINCRPLALTEQPGMSAQQLIERTRFLCCGALYLMQALLADARPALKTIHVTQGAQRIDADDRVWNPEAAVLWGINKTAALEHPELNNVVVDLDEDAASLSAFIRTLQQHDGEPQSAFRHGQRFVARYQRVAPDITRSWQAIDKGSIDALVQAAQPRTLPASGQIEIRVQQAGLNFIDVIDVLGLLPFARAGLGIECVGTIIRVGDGVEQFSTGQQVLALAEGAFADFVTVDARLAAPLPAKLSAAEAATLPVAFLTAAYALEDVACIRPGQRVLIHAATGGTGMAVVQIAMAAGAEVYATASPEKWPVLQNLGVKAVMNSRDLSFVDEINRLTGGVGVDIVFNSLTGDFIKAGLSLLKTGGCFIEIGKREVLTEEQAAKFAPGVHYRPVDLRELSQVRPEKIQSLFGSIIERVVNGDLKPLPYRRFDWRQMTDAFRFMQQAKHTGKIVLEHQDNRLCRDYASYLITGGFKGLGFYTAQWLVKQGAKHIVLIGRTAPAVQYQAELDKLIGQGVDIKSVIADVNDDAAMQAVFDAIRQTPYPLKGIVHSVGVLNDGALLQQNWERFEPVLMPKIAGAWRLHQLSLADELDFFVLYSSVASLLGSAGQANHAAANAYLDAFAQYRRALGLPAQSINWCGWSDIGSAAERGVSDRIRKGLAAITPETGAEVLARVLARDEAQLGVTPIAWEEFLQDAAMPAYFERFQDASPTCIDAGGQRDFVAETSQREPSALLQAGAPERGGMIKDLIAGELATVLGMETAQLKQLAQRKSGFFELGLDSLTSVEFKNRLNRSLGLSISAASIFDYPNVAALSGYLSGLLAEDSEPDIAVTPETGLQDAEELDELSIEQAALLLARELE